MQWKFVDMEIIRTILKARGLCQLCSRCRAGVVKVEMVVQRSCPRMERRQPSAVWGFRSGGTCQRNQGKA